MKGEDLPDHDGELSEIAEIHSIVNVKVFRLFIYVIVLKHGSRGRIAKENKFKEAKDITDKGQRFPLNGRWFWKWIL